MEGKLNLEQACEIARAEMWEVVLPTLSEDDADAAPMSKQPLTATQKPSPGFSRQIDEAFLAGLRAVAKEESTKTTK